MDHSYWFHAPVVNWPRTDIATNSTISTIIAIDEKKFKDRSDHNYGNHSPVIAPIIAT